MSDKKKLPNYKVFQPSQDGGKHHNIHLDWYNENTPGVLIEGYREAAVAVYNMALDSMWHPERYFYPAAFLYRHCIELQLKKIIKDGGDLLDQKTDPTKFRHNLKTMWDHASKILLEIYSDSDKSELDKIGALILEFHEVDPYGDGCRYYTNSQGDVNNLKNAPRIFSFHTFVSQMDEIYQFLSSCDCGITEYLSNKNEAEAESGPY